MKKQLLMTLALFAAIAMGASAQIFETSNFFFKVVDAAGAKVEIQRPFSGDQYLYYNNISGTLPETVTYNGITYTVVGVGERAMQGAKLSSDLIIPDSYTYLADWAFREVSGNSVTIGANLVDFGLGAFSCNTLKEFKCDSANPMFTVLTSSDDSNSAGVLVSKDKTELTFFPGGKTTKFLGFITRPVTSYTVPSFITKIGDYAFQKHSDLQTITFHSGMERIGAYAFYECLELKSVSIPYGCQLGKGAFGACEFNLTSVTLGGGQTVIPAYCFFDSDALRSITLPEGVVEIGDFAFNYSGITSVTLPSTVKRLGYNSFSYGPNLASVTINDALENVDERAFGNILITDIDLKNVKYLGPFVFQSCRSLANVTMNHVERIDNAAFFGCSALTHVDLPETLTTLDGVTFFNCSKLESLTIPKNVSKIGHGITVGTYALPSIQVDEENEHFVSIDGCLYDKDVKKLYAVPCGKSDSMLVVPETVDTIGEQAARYARVKTITTGRNLKYISSSGFATNPVLEEVTLGASVDSIKEMVFTGCPAIVKVTSLNRVPPVGPGVASFNVSTDDNGNVTSSVYANATLYVPRGSKEVYAADENWGKFEHIEEIDVEEPELKLGDLNGDGLVDVSDVSILIDVVLGKEVSLADGAVTDLNNDGNNDVTDVSMLIDLVLGKL